MAEGKKRLVKNPETFRERALKADQPKEEKTSRGILLSPFRLIASIFRSIAKGTDKLSKVKSLKPIFSILRFIGKIIWPAYFRNSVNELKGVTWPTPKMSVRLTYAVIAFAVVFGITIAVVDYGLDKVFKVLLLK